MDILKSFEKFTLISVQFVVYVFVNVEITFGRKQTICCISLRTYCAITNLLQLTLSSYILPFLPFNTLKKKNFRKILWKKMKLLKMSNFTFFHNVFFAIYILNPKRATLHLSSTDSLNFAQSQNFEVGNGLS